MKNLEGKVALVTGATRGIGASIAIALGELGAIVIGTATQNEGAENISKYLKENNISGRGIVLNVTDARSIEEAINQITEQYGPPLILVNNAGVTDDNLFLRMKPEQWDRVIDTNLNSIFRVTRVCIKAMFKARWGRIINISSVVGVSGNPGQANYCASKAGVIGFTKSLAQEMASTGITANVVAPGFIDTDMTNKLNEKQRETLLAQIPMKRIGKPNDIAHAVTFLASEGANYISGQTLHVNGGLYMI